MSTNASTSWRAGAYWRPAAAAKTASGRPIGPGPPSDSEAAGGAESTARSGAHHGAFLRSASNAACPRVVAAVPVYLAIVQHSLVHRHDDLPSDMRRLSQTAPVTLATPEPATLKARGRDANGRASACNGLAFRRCAVAHVAFHDRKPPQPWITLSVCKLSTMEQTTNGSMRGM